MATSAATSKPPGAPGPEVPEVVVIGLGPGPVELLTERARRLWGFFAPDARFARTERHPAAAALGPQRSFDDVYEQARVLDDVYPAIVERLVAEAGARGRVAYAVPGSPLVAERTVELLRGDDRVTVTIEPALSFLDLAWARLGVDPLAAGVRLVDGQRFAVEAAGATGPLLVGQCDSLDVLSAIKLAVEDAPEEPVVVLQRLGLPDESVSPVAWADLDRAVRPDHLTSLWVPRLAPPVGAELIGFWELVRTLRARCPWDRAQTPHSLRPYLLEESYEVLDALDRLDPSDGRGADDVADELGDLLFQVVFHAVIAEESGWFTLADVAAGIHRKLVRRHPHVFGATLAGTAGDIGTAGTAGDIGTAGTAGDIGTAGTAGDIGTAGTAGDIGTAGTAGDIGTAGTAGDIGTAGTAGDIGTAGTAGDIGTAGTAVRNWDDIKRQERAEKFAAGPASAADAPPGPFDGVPRALPALAYAAKLQRRAAAAGHDPDAGLAGLRPAMEVVMEATAPSAEQLGDALFALVARTRSSGLDPEEALREAANRFRAALEPVPPPSEADAAERGRPSAARRTATANVSHTAPSGHN